MVLPPRAAESKGRESRYFKPKKNYFLYSNFKLPRQIKVNLINVIFFFKVPNFSRGAVTVIPRPGSKKKTLTKPLATIKRADTNAMIVYTRYKRL